MYGYSEDQSIRRVGFQIARRTGASSLWRLMRRKIEVVLGVSHYLIGIDGKKNHLLYIDC